MPSAPVVSRSVLKGIGITSLSACFSSQMSTLEVSNRKQRGNCRQDSFIFLGRHRFCVNLKTITMGMLSNISKKKLTVKSLKIITYIPSTTLNPVIRLCG